MATLGDNSRQLLDSALKEPADLQEMSYNLQGLPLW